MNSIVEGVRPVFEIDNKILIESVSYIHAHNNMLFQSTQNVTFECCKIDFGYDSSELLECLLYIISTYINVSWRPVLCCIRLIVTTIDI